MRIEKEGFVLNLEGTWCEISNKYGVQEHGDVAVNEEDIPCLLYTSPSPRDRTRSRMPSSA